MDNENESPPMSGYYVLSISHSAGSRYLSWWGPRQAGYTLSLGSAGLYTDREIAAQRGRLNNGRTTLAVPCELASRHQGSGPVRAVPNDPAIMATFAAAAIAGPDKWCGHVRVDGEYGNACGRCAIAATDPSDDLGAFGRYNHTGEEHFFDGPGRSSAAVELAARCVALAQRWETEAKQLDAERREDTTIDAWSFKAAMLRRVAAELRAAVEGAT